MVSYRDIGKITGTQPQSIATEPVTSQVYKATHNGAGEILPHMQRSFISFSFGGIKIEDLGFLAITRNRLEKNISSAFEDLVSDYDVLDGQFYWGSRYLPNQLNFILSTDGVTQKQLEEFKTIFRGGVTKELILAEHPNRGIYARVAEAPVISLMPFEEKATQVILGQEYETSTTLYKGDIALNFIMDAPYWHSIINCYDETVADAKGSIVSTLTDKDTIKVIIEDGIPYIGMVRNQTFLGDGIYQYGHDKIETIDIDPESSSLLYYAGTAPANTQLSFNFTPKLVNDDIILPETFIYNALVDIAMVDYSNVNQVIENISISALNAAPALIGTAVIGESALGSVARDDTQFYIAQPYNIIYKEKIGGDKECNYLSVGDRVFSFTLPSIYMGYNQALKIINDFNDKEVAVIDVVVALREGITDYYARAWAITIINLISAINNYSDSNFIWEKYLQGTYMPTSYIFNKLMWIFLLNDDGETISDASVSFNSETGEAIGTFSAREIDVESFDPEEARNQADLFSYIFSISTPIEVTENVGNMVCDDYLILNEKTRPNAAGTIEAEDCLLVSTDLSDGLKDVNLEYKHTYL